ncbi:hypothetical protein ACW5R3_02745 [Bizionia sp. KMM 8389]
MKSTNTKPARIPGLYCSLFGHNFRVSRNVTLHVKEYECKTCKKQATTNGNGGISELTPKYREINSILERIHNNRIMRLNTKEYTKETWRILT